MANKYGQDSLGSFGSNSGIVLTVAREMVVHSVRWLIRNIAGYLALAIGVVLSLPFIPGPGFAFVLLGLGLADWPGKCRFFRWLRTFHWFEACERWLEKKFGVRLPASSYGASTSPTNADSSSPP